MLLGYSGEACTQNIWIGALALHNNDITLSVWGDIKAANVFLGYNGHWRLMDAGLWHFLPDSMPSGDVELPNAPGLLSPQGFACGGHDVSCHSLIPYQHVAFPKAKAY